MSRMFCIKCCHFLLLLLIVLHIKHVNTRKQLTDCSYVVNSNNVDFIGCKEMVGTESLTHRRSRRKAIYSFKGIPYAEPPIGALRFRKPLPKVYTKPTVVKATHHQKPCLQTWIADWPFGSMSEDCLHLNIWSPNLNSSANLPVMFWIYGGAFLIGSSSQFGALFLTTDNIYEGNQLTLRDVIVVSFNYRLGVFGFLYGNTSDCPGNQGFWDQALALKWVKNNIRAFGGNPNDITLFGESAGSISISYHLVSKFTRNMFQRAIMQSGSGYIKLFSRDVKYSYEIARRYASNTQLFRRSGPCIHDQNWIECLRSKTAGELLLAQLESIIYTPTKPWYTAYLNLFCPLYGDEFLPISINKAVKIGEFRRDVNILIGHTEMEGAMFTSGFDLVKGLLGRYFPFIPIAPIITRDVVFNDIRNYFFDNDTIGVPIAHRFTQGFSSDVRRLDTNGIRRSALHAFGDYFLTCPTILFGGHIVRNKEFSGKIYQYRLTYANRQSIARNSIWANATHTDDLPLVFGLPFRDKILWSNSDRKLSKIMMDIWTHFAKYDKLPKVNGNVWPTYGLTADRRVNASYIELHASSARLGRVWTNRYNYNPEENPPLINDCFYHWDVILSGQFGDD